MCTRVRVVSITIRNFCMGEISFLTTRIFSGSGNRDLAESICQYLGVPLQNATVIDENGCKCIGRSFQ